MRKIVLLLVLLSLLSGCATYKFQKGPAPYEKGYVVSYDGKLIPEYTLGQDNSVPGLVLAKERFNRRRATVEYYYKKMGQIEARIREFFWDPPAMLVDLIGGLLRWPFVAVADYKYNHNLKYKEKVDQLDEQRDELEKVRINNLKAKLKIYIDGDLVKEFAQKEPPVSEIVVSPQQAPVTAAPASPVAVIIPDKAKRAVPKEKKKVLPVEPVNLEPPVAVIIAKPIKGPSPLQVNFNGAKSYSKSNRIVSYVWDFGDGDASIKNNPVNTYWSTTYGSRNFTATLTVKDEKGQTASTSTNIEVIAK
ncbi:MAG: PKD domain-containing protein [Candidatus Omnitrophica bacterium]|nr:PKD domain-containing protein [Candidatus Omnitrophota bacterium]MBU1923244.1 PKD domain-containing protein [Candidatus Omnitrophota bacterium]